MTTWNDAVTNPPPDGQRVLIAFGDGKMTVGVMRSGWWLADWQHQADITHWLPLPSAPDAKAPVTATLWGAL